MELENFARAQVRTSRADCMLRVVCVLIYTRTHEGQDFRWLMQLAQQGLITRNKSACNDRKVSLSCN